MSNPFDAITSHPSSIDMLRAAAGIYIPNRAFRDRNPSLHTGTYTGPDGIAWNRSDFRGWYYTGTYEPGDAYGSQQGAKRPHGAYDAATIYTRTASTSTATDPTNHSILGATIFTDYLAFYEHYRGHYSKPITMAMMARISSDCTIGTNIKAFLNCYGSDGLFDGAVEIEFDDAGDPGTGAWQRLTARSKAEMPSSTHWVQLHIGISSPDGVLTGYEFAEVSLMLNPETVDIATDSSPAEWIDLDGATMRVGAAMQFGAIQVQDKLMLDGRRTRSTMVADNLRYQFACNFSQVDDEKFRKLLVIWNLGTRGLGFHVPQPVPLCIDFGLGTGPFFGYYYPSGATFTGSHSRNWTLTDQKFDVSVRFEEA
jgi:hypothetical protein